MRQRAGDGLAERGPPTLARARPQRERRACRSTPCSCSRPEPWLSGPATRDGHGHGGVRAQGQKPSRGVDVPDENRSRRRPGARTSSPSSPTASSGLRPQELHVPDRVRPRRRRAPLDALLDGDSNARLSSDEATLLLGRTRALEVLDPATGETVAELHLERSGARGPSVRRQLLTGRMESAFESPRTSPEIANFWIRLRAEKTPFDLGVVHLHVEPRQHRGKKPNCRRFMKSISRRHGENSASGALRTAFVMAFIPSTRLAA